MLEIAETELGASGHGRRVIVMDGCEVSKVTTWSKPAGAGSEEQKLPVVTTAGIPSACRSLCRTLGSKSTFWLMVSVAVPLACSTRVKAVVWIVPVP
jgi:hypothetical protein